MTIDFTITGTIKVKGHQLNCESNSTGALTAITNEAAAFLRAALEDLVNEYPSITFDTIEAEPTLVEDR